MKGGDTMYRRMLLVFIRRIRPTSLIVIQYLELAMFVVFAFKGIGKRVRRYKHMVKVEK